MELRTTTGNEREVAAVAQLEGLLERYDLSRWCFTDVCRVQSMVVPRSHPVLRLNTRHLGDDDQALSTFLHEQLHWWLYQHPGADGAIEAVRARWPEPPGATDGGAANAFSTWLHLVLCPLEMQAVEEVLGHDLPQAARASGHYSWIYQQVQQDPSWFADLAAAHDLVPPPEAPVPSRWEPLADLGAVTVYGLRTSTNDRLVELVRETHATHELAIGELEVTVDSDRETGIHPSLSVGPEHLDDPDAFALVYAYWQAAFWANGDRVAHEAIASLDPDIVTALGGPPFGGSTAVAGTVALDALGQRGHNAIDRTPLAGRLTALLPHLAEVRSLLARG
jgi:hypothetical protein